MTEQNFCFREEECFLRSKLVNGNQVPRRRKQTQTQIKFPQKKKKFDQEYREEFTKALEGDVRRQGVLATVWR
jgi:hypothetical protein